MGMTLSQKVLARTSGRKEASVGEVLWVEPDLFQLHDLVLPHYLKTLTDQGILQVRYPDRCVVFADHEVPAQTVRVAELKKAMRGQLAVYGITQFHSEGTHGISHQAIVEQGYVRPGMLVVSVDTHVTTLGCVGALAPPINYEAIQALAMGEIWLKVPETIKINLSGKARAGVMSRDIAQQVIARLGPDLCDYKVLQFAGDAIPDMNMDMRMTLCNVTVDVGAKGGVVEADDVTQQYLKGRARGPVDVVRSDPDASYSHIVDFDLGELEPMVAVPPRPDFVVGLSKVAGIKVDQVYVGSCAGGRMEDLRAAANVLRGRRVHPDVRMFVIPTSQEIYVQASREGLLADMAAAGAVVGAPSCGPCYGNLAPLSDREVCIGTGTTNIPGRMGSAEASIYLSNAAVAAASAVAGCISDPATLAQGGT
jgi:3-isopropylmalate/(R)-2-methylmalate dehydratase large subunit